MSRHAESENYLKQDYVMKLMDEVVGQLLKNKPAEPSQFLATYLAKKHNVTVESSTVVSNSAGAPPPLVSHTATNVSQGGGGTSLHSATSDPIFNALEHVVTATESAARHDDLSFLKVMNENFERYPVNVAGLMTRAHESLQIISSPLRRMVSDTCSSTGGTTPHEEKSKRKMAQALFEAAELVVGRGLDLQHVVSGVLESAKKLIHADRCSVFVANEKTRTLTTTIEGKTFSMLYGQGVAGTVARTNCSLLITNAYEDKRFDPKIDFELGYTTRDILCLPILLEDKLLAVVQLVNKIDGSFCEDDEQLFAAFAQFAAIGLRNAMLFAEQSRLALRNKFIAEVTESLANTELVESHLIPVIIKHAKAIVGADRCAFFSVDNDRDLLIAHLEGVREQMELPKGSGVVGWVAQYHQPLNIPEAYKDPRFNKEVDIVSGYHTANILCIPIFVDRQIVAVSQLVNKKDPKTEEILPFNEEDVEVLQSFASIAGVCIRNCRLYSDIKRGKEVVDVTLEVARTISETDVTHLDAINDAVVESVCRATKAEHCLLFSLDNNYKNLVASDPSKPLQQQSEGNGNSNNKTIVIPYSGSQLGDIARSKKTARFSQLDRPVDKSVLSGIIGGKAKEYVAVPVSFGQETVGVILAVKETQWFDDNDVETIELFSLFAAVAVRNFKLFTAFREECDDWYNLANIERQATDDLSTPSGMEGSSSHGGTSTGVSGAGVATNPFSTANALSESFVVSNVEPERVDIVQKTEPPNDQVLLLPTHKFNIHLFKDDILEQKFLLPLAVHMFKALNLLKTFNIKEEALCKFLLLVQSKYRSVPYHNFFHAFDVTQTIFSFLHQGRLLENGLLNNMDVLSLMIAGLVHDIDHMGLNNTFHMKAETPMGILTSLTGNRSVLEVHHCQLAIEILGLTNLFIEMSQCNRTVLYKNMIDAVLATDMARHKELSTQIDTELRPFLQDFFNKKPKTTTTTTSTATGKDGEEKNLPPQETRRLLLILLLKMADISNITKEFDTSRKWGLSVMEEFYLQGDAERGRGLDVTPQFDREKKVELAKGQIGFINFLGKPFFTLGVQCLPDLHYLTDGIAANLAMWEKLLSQHK